MSYFRNNKLKYLAMAIVIGFCIAGCGKSKPEAADTSQDSSAATPEPTQQNPSKSYNPVPGYKQRLNKVLDDGAVEREKRVQEIFQ